MCYVLGCNSEPIAEMTYQDNLIKTHTEQRCTDCAEALFNSDKKILDVDALDETEWAKVRDSVRETDDDEDSVWEDIDQFDSSGMALYSGNTDAYSLDGDYSN
jgi:hypothetical protein